MKKIIVLFIAAALLLCSCGITDADTSYGEISSEISNAESKGDISHESEVSYIAKDFSQETINDGVDDEDIGCTIVFGSSVSIKGVGATADGNIVTVSAAGTYSVSGSCDDCRIVVEASKDDQIELVFYNAELSSKSGPVIEGLSSDRIKIVVPSGSVSVISDASEYTYGGEANAAIWSKDDLTVKGNGSLTVNGNCNNGISSTNDIKIICADLTVNAADNGIRGKDSITVESGSEIKIVSGGAGLKSSESEDETKGYILLDGGIIDIVSDEDGITAQSYVNVGNCKLNIVSGGGSSKSYNDTVSRKGIKSAGDINVLSGITVIDSNDDSLHCAGTLTVSGGETTISSGDDGAHSDSNLYIKGGKITVSKSYEGLEGQNVYISGGIIDVTASDDGINAAGGSDTQGGNRMGFNPFGSSGGDYQINISGGTTTVNACGDGIDSNGYVYVSGGTLLVSGPTDNGNNALDYETGMVITGGTVLGAGSSGMAENATTGTTQVTVMVSSSSYVSGSFSISDGDTVIYEYTPAKQYNNVVFSHPDLEVGKTYTVKMGTTTQTITVSDIITGSGGMGGGGQGGPGGQGDPGGQGGWGGWGGGGGGRRP